MNNKKTAFYAAVCVAAAALFCGVYFMAAHIAENQPSVPASAAEEKPEPLSLPEKKEEKSNIQHELDEFAKAFSREFEYKYARLESPLKFAFAIEDLKTGDKVMYNENEQLNSASVIKLYIAMTAYDVENDVENNGEKMPDGMRKSIEKMITESNNDESRKVTKWLTDGDSEKHKDLIRNENDSNTDRMAEERFKKINNTILKYGFSDKTKMQRDMFNDAPPGGSSGFDNFTTVSDCCMFLKKVYTGELVSKKYSEELYDLLKSQKRDNKIQRYIKRYGETDTVVRNKTGDLQSVENDVGIITGTGKNGTEYAFSLCVMVNGIPKKPAVTDNKNSIYREDIQNDIANMAIRVQSIFEALY